MILWVVGGFVLFVDFGMCVCFLSGNCEIFGLFLLVGWWVVWWRLGVVDYDVWFGEVRFVYSIEEVGE